ncbi:MAG: hypothetical protein HQL31_09295, partial [Planctomycetes bacterium]|nr:hypothetical protein [Planctomycetota bacterium]
MSKVAVIGLGYVGLPLAVALGKGGHQVIGIDSKKSKIEQLRRFSDVTGELESVELEEAGNEYSDDFARIAGSEFVIVAVPTPVDEHHQPDLVLAQLADDVHDLGVPEIGNILLEGQPQNQNAGVLDAVTVANQKFDGLFRDEFSHAVIDAPAGGDHLRLITQGTGLVGEIVGINPDTVTTDQPRKEGQEVPLGAGRSQHVPGADIHAVEDQRQLVHERDVEVALRILDDLGRFGDLDRGRPENPCRDDAAVELRDRLQRRLVLAADDLDHLVDGVRLVAGVDALRTVTETEIAPPHPPLSSEN